MVLPLPVRRASARLLTHFIWMPVCMKQGCHMDSPVNFCMERGSLLFGPFIYKHIIRSGLDGNFHIPVFPCLCRSYAGILTYRHISFIINGNSFCIYRYLRSFTALGQIHLKAYHSPDILMGCKLHRGCHALLTTFLTGNGYVRVAYTPEPTVIRRTVQHNGNT